MRRTDVLITAARRISRSSANADSSLGISDEEFLQYLNDAQDRIQNLTSATKNIAKIFATQAIISVVANQEAYSIPDRLLLNKQIEMVEFSATGLVGDYVRLEKLNFFNRDTNASSYPWGYFKRGGQIFLQPTPSISTGTIRVTYERTLDDLDIPRATVNTVTGSATAFTQLTLNATPADSYTTTVPGFNTQQYCCVVNTLGARKAFNVLIGSYTSATHVLVPSGGTFTYDTTYDSQIVANDVLVFDKYKTTFSQLPDDCERYLVNYTAMEVFHRDSSEDYSKQRDLVAEIEEDTIKALASQTSEVQYVPQMDRYEWW